MHATHPGHIIPLNSTTITMPKTLHYLEHFFISVTNIWTTGIIIRLWWRRALVLGRLTLQEATSLKDLELLTTNNASVGQLVSLITQVPEVDSLETSDIDRYQYGLWPENTQPHLVAKKTSYLNTNLYLNLQN